MAIERAPCPGRQGAGVDGARSRLRKCRDLAAVILASAVLTAISPGMVTPARAAKLPIIVYHQLRSSTDGTPDAPDVISVEKFERQMRYLHDQGYRTLSADEVIACVRSGSDCGEKTVAIHFDDGWKSAQLALPMLDRYAFKATFWIIAGKGIGWPHLDWDEVLAIAANSRYDVGSHSMTHPWKAGDTMLDWVNGRTPGKGIEQVRQELADSRRILAEKLRRPVSYLAWPAGHYNEDMIRVAVDAGYTALFTIDAGLNPRGTSPLRIERTMIDGACDQSAFVSSLSDGRYRDCSRGNAPHQ